MKNGFRVWKVIPRGIWEKKKKKGGVAAVGTQGIKFLSLPTGYKEMEFLCLQRMAISIIIF